MNQWTQKLLACKTNIDRCLLAEDPKCEVELLRAFCFEDLDPAVVREAALNPTCPSAFVDRALTRFPELDTDYFRQEQRSRAIEYLEDTSGAVSGDRDQIILQHILNEDKLDHANSHLGPLEPTQVSKYVNPNKSWPDSPKGRVAMVMMPAWGILFPPYNIAKLTGILRDQEWSTKVYDLNIESYHSLMATDGQDYWRGERYFLWMYEENFVKLLLPQLKPLFDRIIEELIQDNPRVIGFSIYNTNVYAVAYMVRILRRRLPKCCIIAGGPEIMTNPEHLKLLKFNYLFVGEAEETLIDTLNNLPNTLPLNEFVGSTNSRLELSGQAYADYSDYHLGNYLNGDGVSIETSRGCVAQCSFCAETYFWKFRSLTPERVVEEMQYQIDTWGVRRFWFVDSLVNGNLKNFERLLDLIIERNLDIKWNSYARCDGRMGDEFFKKIVLSGCTCLSYGVESGSQKVLYDMRKKIELSEIESNLALGHRAGVYNHANWIMGFPTETALDFMHSLQLLYNIRLHLNVISPGFGAGPAEGSDMSQRPELYGMSTETLFEGSWHTKDMTNTILHRGIRVKLFHIWLEILGTHSSSIIHNSQRHPNVTEFYSWTKGSGPTRLLPRYDPVFVDNIISDTDFESSVAQEYMSIIYALYMHLGSGTFTMSTIPALDQATWGSALAFDYTLGLTVTITDDEYEINLAHKFVSETHPFDQTRVIKGNFKELKTTSSTLASVHDQYNKKVIPILSN